MNVINNRGDLQKFLLATSDFGKNVEENLNTVIADGKFNNAILRHALGLTDKNIFDIPSPLEVTLNILKHLMLKALLL